MRKELFAIGVGAVIMGGLWATNVNAQTTTPKVSVGISIDQRSGPPTETTINCFGDGRHSTVNGDGTLFMENRTPHTMLCSISIKRVGTTT